MIWGNVWSEEYESRYISFKNNMFMDIGIWEGLWLNQTIVYQFICNFQGWFANEATVRGTPQTNQ